MSLCCFSLIASVVPLNPQKNKWLEYMHSLMLYNERDMSPIQYTKNINGMASLVDAIRKIQEEYDSQGHIRIQFDICSCKVVDRNEREKINE